MTPLEAAIELMRRYRYVTPSEVRTAFGTADKWIYTSRGVNEFAHKLLFFDDGSCILCLATTLLSGDGLVDCDFCIHRDGDGEEPCQEGPGSRCWDAMMEAVTPKEALRAYRRRALYLESLIEKEKGVG